MTGRSLLAFALALLAVGPVLAQLPQARITSVFPPGAQRGATVDVVVGGGSDLDELDAMIFSHPEITATQKRDAGGNPVASTFTVTVGGNVPAGLYDVRVRGLFGISNPRIFRVDSLPEIAETEPNNAAPQATPVSLESIVSGRANGATDVDFFRFPVKAGQTFVIRSEAARLDSPMQPLLQLFNAAGRRVAESRRVFSQEASIVHTPAADEEYLLRVQDAVYGGGDQFVYRLAVDTRPQVDWSAPGFIAAGAAGSVTLYGRHLPGGEATDLKLGGQPVLKLTASIDPATAGQPVGAAATAAFAQSFWWNGVDGNLLRLGLAPQAALLEDPAAAEQSTALPAEIAGRFAERGDEDVFRFEAKKGDSWVIEVFAQRLGSIADPLLMIERINTAADGTVTYARVATEDDDRQNPGGADLPTLSDDPSARLDVPEDGNYRIRLRDRYSDARGDARLSYRVSIRKPQPDYSLVVFDSFPSADGKAPPTSGAISLRKGGSYELPVYAYRRDGHNDAIEIAAVNLPAGLSARPSVIGPGQTTARIVITAAPDAPELLAPVSLQGRSGPADAALIREARTATLVHDALNGLPRTARLSDSLIAGVMKDEQPFSVVVDIAAADYSQDQQLLIPVRIVKRNGFDGKVDFAFYNVPGETDAPAFAIEPGKDSALARIYFKEKAPVSAAAILLHGTSTVAWRRNPWLAERARLKVTEAEASMATRQTQAQTAEAALKEQQLKVTALTEQVKKLGEELAAYTVQQQKLKEDFTKAVAAQTASLETVAKAQAQAASIKASATGKPEELVASLKALQEAADALATAAVKVEELTTAADAVAKQVTSVKELEAAKIREKAEAEKLVAEKMKDVETAQAMLTQSMKDLEAAKAAKAAADDGLKKAEEATKPNNVAVRAVSDPIVVRIHAGTARVSAAVPDNGVLKRGGMLAIKVTAARRKEFTGPLKLTLELPPGTTGIQAAAVDLPADQSEAMLTVTAAADAPVGDLANVVIRATGDVSGRAAATDVPVAIKIAE